MSENENEFPESSSAPELPEDPVSAPLDSAPVITRDDAPEEASDDSARSAAFSEEPEFQGRAIKPWSFNREALFYQQRAAVGAPPLDAVLIDQDAFLADAARILWLCSHEPSAFRSLRSDPASMQEVIDAWADENIPPAHRLEASLVAMRIFENAALNLAVPADSGTPGK